MSENVFIAVFIIQDSSTIENHELSSTGVKWILRTAESLKLELHAKQKYIKALNAAVIGMCYFYFTIHHIYGKMLLVPLLL